MHTIVANSTAIGDIKGWLNEARAHRPAALVVVCGRQLRQRLSTRWNNCISLALALRVSLVMEWIHGRGTVWCARIAKCPEPFKSC
eukprot:1696906-Rhodomonas_salina.1